MEERVSERSTMIGIHQGTTMLELQTHMPKGCVLNMSLRRGSWHVRLQGKLGRWSEAVSKNLAVAIGMAVQRLG